MAVSKITRKTAPYHIELVEVRGGGSSVAGTTQLPVISGYEPVGIVAMRSVGSMSAVQTLYEYNISNGSLNAY